MNAPLNQTGLRTVADHIRNLLGDDYDDTTFLDTLEGETDVMEILDRLGQDLVEAQAMQDAAASILGVYRERMQRFDNKRTNIRNAMANLLDVLGVDKVKRPLFTASRLKGRDSVVIDDEDAVPTQLCKIMKTPDKAAIKKQLDAGETVPGAHIETGPRGLAVRV